MLKSNILGFRYVFLGVKACELPTIWAFDCFHCLKNPLVSIDGYKTNKKTKNETNNNKNGLVFFVVFVVLD